MRTIFVSLLLFSYVSCALAQTHESYIEPHRGAVLGAGSNQSMNGPNSIASLHIGTDHTTTKRMGWNHTSEIWQETDIYRANNLTKQGEAEFRSGNLNAAEALFRSAIYQAEYCGTAYAGLARVFVAKGQIFEAIECYRTLFYDISMRGINGPNKEDSRQKIYRNPVGASQYVADGLRYALLLNRTGQWSEAVIVYNSALQGVPGGELPKLDLVFDASDPQPIAFEAAVRVALGLTLNFSADDDKNQEAMKEYTKALSLEPDAALTNYYYGFGYQMLSPTERIRLGSAQHAEAALRKAVKIGKGPVKAAAQRALRVAMKP